MTSEVPLARGLGSSSSVIVAGIGIGQPISANLQLSDAEKLRIATEIGHPDNVAPAIFGNMVIAELHRW